MQLEGTINPRRMGLILGLIAIYLAAQSLFNEYLLETFVGSDSEGMFALFLDLFSVNLEESIPTWYSTLNLMIAASLLTIIAVAKRASSDRYTIYWVGLAVIFLYLSIDEGAAIHEIFSDPVQETFNTSGFLSFGWLLVAAPLVVVFGLLYLRFLLHLPTRTRNLLVVAGVLYVGGAMVVEGISANQYELGGGVTLAYLGIATVEELFEMLGVALLIYTLLEYLGNSQYSVTLWSKSTTDQDESNRARLSVRARPSGFVLITAILIGNIASYSLAVSQTPASDTGPQNSALAYQMIIDELVTDETVVTHTPGVFSAENLVSRQVADTMLDMFDAVMVVALPEFESSIIIAADTLPFDQSSLSDVLHANGETQFIIFDTSIVRMMAG